MSRFTPKLAKDCSTVVKNLVPGAGFELATSGHGPINCSPDYESGFNRNPTALRYRELRSEFLDWLKSKKLNPGYARDILSYLDRFVTQPIREPMDLVKIFTRVTPGQQHNLIPAVKGLLKFAKLKGYNERWLNSLKQGIPRDEEGIDLKVPSEEQIVDSLKAMKNAKLMKHRVAYNLALDSGLRLTEVMCLLRNFEELEAQRGNGLVMVPVGMFRKSKLAYYGFFTEHTMQLIGELNGEDHAELSAKAASKYVQKREEVVAFKYLRKFAFDKMIELEIPESVADFIQGRTPKRIGAKHYMVLLRQARKFYPRYATCIRRLRQKAIA